MGFALQQPNVAQDNMPCMHPTSDRNSPLLLGHPGTTGFQRDAMVPLFSVLPKGCGAVHRLAALHLVLPSITHADMSIIYACMSWYYTIIIINNIMCCQFGAIHRTWALGHPKKRPHQGSLKTLVWDLFLKRCWGLFGELKLSTWSNLIKLSNMGVFGAPTLKPTQLFGTALGPQSGIYIYIYYNI